MIKIFPDSTNTLYLTLSRLALNVPFTIQKHKPASTDIKNSTNSWRIHSDPGLFKCLNRNRNVCGEERMTSSNNYQERSLAVLPQGKPKIIRKQLSRIKLTFRQYFIFGGAAFIRQTSRRNQESKAI